MRASPHLKLVPSLALIHLAPFINLFFLLILFFTLSPYFTTQSGIPIQFTQSVPHEILKNDNLIITITSEDILYFREKIITINELAQLLSTMDIKKYPVLIKVDRRASLGRIVDVWNLFRRLGVERLNIATHQEE